MAVAVADLQQRMRRLRRRQQQRAGGIAAALLRHDQHVRTQADGPLRAWRPPATLPPSTAGRRPAAPIRPASAMRSTQLRGIVAGCMTPVRRAGGWSTSIVAAPSISFRPATQDLRLESGQRIGRRFSRRASKPASSRVGRSDCRTAAARRHAGHRDATPPACRSSRCRASAGTGPGSATPRCDRRRFRARHRPAAAASPASTRMLLPCPMSSAVIQSSSLRRHPWSGQQHRHQAQGRPLRRIGKPGGAIVTAAPMTAQSSVHGPGAGMATLAAGRRSSTSSIAIRLPIIHRLACSSSAQTRLGQRREQRRRDRQRRDQEAHPGNGERIRQRTDQRQASRTSAATSGARPTVAAHWLVTASRSAEGSRRLPIPGNATRCSVAGCPGRARTRGWRRPRRRTARTRPSIPPTDPPRPPPRPRATSCPWRRALFPDSSSPQRPPASSRCAATESPSRRAARSRRRPAPRCRGRGTAADSRASRRDDARDRPASGGDDSFRTAPASQAATRASMVTCMPEMAIRWLTPVRENRPHRPAPIAPWSPSARPDTTPSSAQPADAIAAARIHPMRIHRFEPVPQRRAPALRTRPAWRRRVASPSPRRGSAVARAHTHGRAAPTPCCR